MEKPFPPNLFLDEKSGLRLRAWRLSWSFSVLVGMMLVHRLFIN